MGRPKGSKDKQPRKRLGQTVTMGEFMPPVGRVELPVVPNGQVEPEDVTFQKFARSVLDDPSYRESARRRFIAGTATPAETRWLIELGRTEEPTKPKGSQWGEYATREEL